MCVGVGAEGGVARGEGSKLHKQRYAKIGNGSELRQQKLRQKRTLHTALKKKKKLLLEKKKMEIKKIVKGAKRGGVRRSSKTRR